MNEKSAFYLERKDETVDFSKNLEFTSSLHESSIPSSLKYMSNILNSNNTNIFINNNNNIYISNPALAPNKNNKKYSNFQEEKNKKAKKEALLKKFEIIYNTKNITIPNRFIQLNKHKKLPMEILNKCPFYLYYLWPGNNKFLLKGRIFSGPRTDCLQVTLSWIAILGISLTFFIISGPILWKNVSPLYICTIIYLFISTILFLLLCMFTDPGVIPPKKIFELFGEVPPIFAYKSSNEFENLKRENVNRLLL